MIERTTNVTSISRSRYARHFHVNSFPSHVGLLNDYLKIPYANGSSFATQFLYRELRARGHKVTVIGPEDPSARPEDLPEHHVALPSLPLRMHPGVHLPLPTRESLASVAAQRFDVMLGQTATELADLGVWLRATHHVPLLCVNTVHLPGAYNVILPDRLLHNPLVNGIFRDGIVPWVERHSAGVYNQSDGLIVLCRGLEQYWRERGVTVPIHVIPRAIEPRIFEPAHARDPFLALSPAAVRGARLLCVCRHTREKDVERLISVFAEHVLPRAPLATLTLVGDGPDHDAFKQHASKLGVGDRVFFPGELKVTEIPAYYRHADLFVYASLSETYGQVVSEALWSGLPVVAFADGMGVSDQILHEHTGLLVAPGPDRARADRELGAVVAELLAQPIRRRAMGELGRSLAKKRVDPERIMNMYLAAFEHARRHCLRSTKARLEQPFVPWAALGRWASIQAALAGLGYLRPETVVNRHGRKQPGWQELESPKARASVQREPAPSFVDAG